MQKKYKFIDHFIREDFENLFAEITKSYSFMSGFSISYKQGLNKAHLICIQFWNQTELNSFSKCQQTIFQNIYGYNGRNTGEVTKFERGTVRLCHGWSKQESELEMRGSCSHQGCIGWIYTSTSALTLLVNWPPLVNWTNKGSIDQTSVKPFIPQNTCLHYK